MALGYGFESTRASTYCGFGFLVDLVGLETTEPHWSYISLVITGPKLQFPGPGRGDQVGLSGSSETGPGVGGSRTVGSLV